jgi:hypothetical protein
MYSGSHSRVLTDKNTGAGAAPVRKFTVQEPRTKQNRECREIYYQKFVDAQIIPIQTIIRTAPLITGESVFIKNIRALEATITGVSDDRNPQVP